MADVVTPGPETTYPRRTSEAFDEMQLFEWVRRQLGYPVVGVELECDHVKDALLEALATYSKYKPRHLFEGWTAPLGVSKHDIEIEGARAVYNVRIETPDSFYGGSVDAQVLGGSYYRFSFSSSANIDIRYYAMMRQWVKIANKELGAEPDFHIDPSRKAVWIYAPTQEVRVTAEVCVDHVGPDTIPAWGQKWMRDYVLAWSKITLGRIRGKFGNSFKGANDTISLDGDALISEGREDLEKLNESIGRGRAHRAPSWG